MMEMYCGICGGGVGTLGDCHGHTQDEEANIEAIKRKFENEFAVWGYPKPVWDYEQGHYSDPSHRVPYRIYKHCVKQSARIKELEEALKDLCDAAELEDDDERGLTTWDAYKNARKTLKQRADV